MTIPFTDCMNRLKNYLYICILAVSCPLLADELTTDPAQPWSVECFPCDAGRYPPLREIVEIENQVVVDLTNPIYEDGILSTHEGGVLRAPDLRVQAKHIIYVRNLEANPPEFSLYCEGDLLIDYRDKALVGQCFYYDFITHSGMLINGRTASPPWYVGGKQIYFHPDQELVIYDGYISTDEGPDKNVLVTSPRITVNRNRIMTAQHINFRIKGVPLFWFPKFNLDLKSIGESPLAVKFGWGGFLGTHLSLRYRFLTLGEFYGFLRLSGYFGRGLGGGIETEYNPRNSSTEFYTRNYYAHDLSINDPEKRDRYRYEGSYFTCLGDDLTVKATYDFVSDGNMAADYATEDFDLKTAGKTQLEIRKNACNWIAALYARIRVNDFQSINQELPTLTYTWRPFEFGTTGIIFENFIRASYLDYRFSDDVQNAKDFHSTRFSVAPRIYRPFCLGAVTFTPEASLIGIAYGNSHGGSGIGQAVGDFGATIETSLSRCLGGIKHVVKPYLLYHYLTPPKVPLGLPYIFTMHDAYNELSVARIGARNSVFVKQSTCIKRPLTFDIWTNVFVHRGKVGRTIQKGYFEFEWVPTDYLFTAAHGAWNFEHRQLDYIDGRTEWSVSQNLAFALEYRHRSKFDWRKADFYNFLLETVRSEAALLASPLSERRDILLARLFYRFNPNLWMKCQLRKGWNLRGILDTITETQGNLPNYTEYEMNLTRVIFDHWHATFTYERRFVDHRYSFTLKLAPSRPS